jgi:hypothetical protein
MLDRIIVNPKAIPEQKATAMYGSHSVLVKRLRKTSAFAKTMQVRAVSAGSAGHGELVKRLSGFAHRRDRRHPIRSKIPANSIVKPKAIPEQNATPT